MQIFSNMQIFSKNNFSYLQFKKFPPKKVSIFFTLKLKPKFSLEELKKYSANLLSKKKEDLIYLQQIHSSKIYLVKNKKTGLNNKGDALITDIKNLPLIIYVADCVAVYFYAKDKNIIALVHSGWRGTLKNIVPKVILKMQKKFKINPKNLICGISPSILDCCYEVNKNLAEKFSRNFSKIQNQIIKQKNKKFYLNLQKIIYFQLRTSGVALKNIEVLNYCTGCNPKLFYSYRKQKINGRMLAAIMLK